MSSRLIFAKRCFIFFAVLCGFTKASADQMDNPAALADLTLACEYVKTRLDIRLNYPQSAEGKKVPCSVSYQRNKSKPIELWKTAEDGEEGFCESRLKMFVDKLLEEDWACKETYIEPAKKNEIAQ